MSGLSDDYIKHVMADVNGSAFTPLERELAREIADLRERFDVLAHLREQREWSARTFGPGPRTKGVVAHIRKELAEIEAAAGDVEEWIDVVILALDGAWRTGASPADVVAALVAKTAKNHARTWPDWRARSEDEPIEHVRAPHTAPEASKGDS